MKHPWSLGKQPSCTAEWMNILFDKRYDTKIAKVLLNHTQSIEHRLHNTLYRLLMRGLYLCIEKPCRQTAIFLTELCGAYEFKYKNPKAGKISNFYKAMKDDSRLAHYVVETCNEIKKMSGKHGYKWFKLRIMIMDVVTAHRMLQSKNTWNVFYGGNAHAKSLEYLLSIEGRVEKNKGHRLEFLKSEILSCTTIYGPIKKYTIMGESHTETRIEFANKLLDFCNEQCHSAEEKISVFIEKHPSNGKDTVQQDLTCNMQDVQSIQRFRCNYPVCSNIDVHDIDVRHVELGFLRYEILTLDYDTEFEKLAKKFQDECLNHLLAIATIYM